MPAFLGVDHESFFKYRLEFLYLIPLNELFVFSDRDITFWVSVFRAFSELIEDFLKASVGLNSDVEPTDLDDLYYRKTMRRLQRLEKQWAEGGG